MVDEWKLIEKFLNQNKNEGKNNFLIHHQLSSYENFIDNDINYIINNYNPFVFRREDIEFKFKITNPRLSRPVFKNKDGNFVIITPEEAINREITYHSNLIVDIEQETIIPPDDEHKEEMIHRFENKGEVIAQIPIMVKSKYCTLNNINYQDNVSHCKFDNGGYFIVNGGEKVIVSQERMCDNKSFVFDVKNSKHSFSCEIRSNTHISKVSQLLALHFNGDKNMIGDCTIKFHFPHLEKPQPLFLLFHYYGITSDKDIINLIIGNDMKCYKEYKELLEPSLVDFKNLNLDSEEKMRSYFESKTKRKNNLDKLLDKDILPHLYDNKKEKVFFLGMMVKQLLDVILKKNKVSDRDHFKNKRIETPGTLLSQVFRSAYESFLNDLRMNSNKELNKNHNIDVIKLVKKSSNITNSIRYALATGNWNVRVKNNKKIGVSQTLSRLTYSSTLSNLRRINAPIGRVSKIIVPRKLHNSQFMYMCAAESPEGATVGLVKNLTIGSFITNYTNPSILKEILVDNNVILTSDLKIKDYNLNMTKILINGVNIGFYGGDSYDLVEKLKNFRRQLIINPEISIYFSILDNTIVIYTDSGRVTRPLLLLENNKLKMSIEEMSKLTWYENIKAGNIEYIDVEESESCMIAMKEEQLKNVNINYTHLEIHPSLMLGVCASLIPLPNHNQSPRNIYQSAMCKQAIGINSTNFINRMDTSTHVLHYPQKPLVYTKAADLLGFNDVPAGKNIVVAIACHTGYNQEDSVILNRSALERGLFHSTYYRTYKMEEKKNLSVMAKEKFCIPTNDNCTNIKYGSYNKLDKTGLVKEGVYVTDKDVIIGKITPVLDKTIDSSKKNLKYVDTSVLLKHNETGTVDKVITTYNLDENKVAKIRIRSLRTPIIGDKFATRQG